MRLFINDIEVDNYAFITEVHDDRIVLDHPIYETYKTNSIGSSPRLYDNIGSIALTRLDRNIIYPDNEVNKHFHCDHKGNYGIYVMHGGLIVPRGVPQEVEKVLYSLFKGNKLRVAGKRYEPWHDKVSFPNNKEFELLWRYENRKGTHNPNYQEDGEISVCTCDYCSNRHWRKYNNSCEFYCGKNMKRLRDRILKSAM